MRLKLATSLKNKTSSLARDPRLLNSVVDTKGRVQKRPSLVASFGPVTVGNGLGLFVRNTPGAPGVPAIPELITITGAVITTAPATYFDATHTLTAIGFDGSGLNSLPFFVNDFSPTLAAGAPPPSFIWSCFNFVNVAGRLSVDSTLKWLYAHVDIETHSALCVNGVCFISSAPFGERFNPNMGFL